MTRRRIALLTPLVFLFFLLLIPLTRAITNHFVEDFTTTDYRDGAYTNAWWDTATGELKLRSFDLSVVGFYDTPGNALGVAVDGDWAYVADGGEGLQILDISFTTPSFVGTYDTPGDVWSVVPAGDHVYITDLGAGLLIIDVSDPSIPSLFGSYDTPGTAYDVELAGDYAYVADGSVGGLQVIDISDPSVPTLAGSYDTPGGAIGVDVEGDWAFVADRGSGLVVLDISDPTNPTLADSHDTPGDCWGVEVSGNHAYLADAGQGIFVIDVSDPANLNYVTGVDPVGSHRRVFVSGDYLYSAAYGYLHVFDISDPSLPFIVDSQTPMNVATTVVVDGKYAYVADGSDGGLQVIEVAAAFEPFEIGVFDTPYRCESVFASGDLLYLAQSGTEIGFRVLDFRFPTGPVEIGSYDVNGNDVFVSGDHAYLSSSEGLTVIDVSDPSNPTIAGSYMTFDVATGVFVSGDHAYLAESFSGLTVIDVTDPSNPTEIGDYDTERAYDVVVTGDRAFVADGSSGLRIIDVTDPSNPSQIGSYVTTSARAVAVAGEYAYVADASGGFVVIDISDPSNPTLADQLATPAWAVSVALSGNYAFVGTGTSVHRVNIEDPTSIGFIGTAPIESYARGLHVAGDVLVVADDDDGIDVMRVFHRRFTAANRARSFPINDTQDDIVRVRLNPSHVDSVQWETSADGGGQFDVVVPGEWSRALVGSSLLWRSTHFPIAHANPKCTELAVDWLYEFPVIESIVDVPFDEGGWVELHLTRSGYDFADEPEHDVEKYIVWRRYQEVGTGIEPSLTNDGSPVPVGGGRARDDMPFATASERRVISDNPNMSSTDLPPGTWEPVDTFPPAQQHTYVVYVPTVIDSGEIGAEPTVLVVSAHITASPDFYVSPPDSGHSRDDIPPSVPTGLTVAYNTGKGNHVSWDASADPDFHHYWIYRGLTEDFIPWTEYRTHKTAVTDWYDPGKDGWQVYYKVSAVDRAGNESDATSPDAVSGIDPDRLPERFALYPNTPNPFNPATVIHYDVPAGGGKMSIRVYDVAGRLVRTLVDGAPVPGHRSAVWNGKDDIGARVASGVYFCRMVAVDYEMTHKMVLLQ